MSVFLTLVGTFVSIVWAQTELIEHKHKLIDINTIISQQSKQIFPYIRTLQESNTPLRQLSQYGWKQQITNNSSPTSWTFHCTPKDTLQNYTKVQLCGTASFTGRFVDLSTSYQFAYTLAALWACGHNRFGDAPNPPIPYFDVAIRLYDDKSTTTGTFQGIKACVDDGYDTLLSPYSSALTDTASFWVQNTSRMLLAGGSAAPGIAQPTENVFRILPPAELYVDRPSRMMRAHGIGQVYVIEEEGSFGKRACAGARNAYFGGGLWNGLLVSDWKRVNEAATQEKRYQIYDKMFHPLQGDRSSVALVGCVYTGICLELVEWLRTNHINLAAILMTSCLQNVAFARNFLRDSLRSEGYPGRFVMGTAAWDISRQRSEYFTVTSTIQLGVTSGQLYYSYSEMFNTELDYHAVAGFSILQTYFAGITLANTTVANDVIPVMQEMTATTPIGPISYSGSFELQAALSVVVQYDSRRNRQVISPDYYSSGETVLPKPTWEFLACDATDRCGSNGECNIHGSCDCKGGYAGTYCEIDYQLTLSIAGTLVGILLIVIGLFFWRRERRVRQKLKAKTQRIRDSKMMASAAQQAHVRALAFVNHRLRNPVHSIQGLLQLIRASSTFGRMSIHQKHRVNALDDCSSQIVSTLAEISTVLDTGHNLLAMEQEVNDDTENQNEETISDTSSELKGSKLLKQNQLQTSIRRINPMKPVVTKSISGTSMSVNIAHLVRDFQHTLASICGISSQVRVLSIPQMHSTHDIADCLFLDSQTSSIMADEKFIASLSTALETSIRHALSNGHVHVPFGTQNSDYKNDATIDTKKDLQAPLINVDKLLLTQSLTALHLHMLETFGRRLNRVRQELDTKYGYYFKQYHKAMDHNNLINHQQESASNRTHGNHGRIPSNRTNMSNRGPTSCLPSPRRFKQNLFCSKHVQATQIKHGQAVVPTDENSDETLDTTHRDTDTTLDSSTARTQNSAAHNQDSRNENVTVIKRNLSESKLCTHHESSKPAVVRSHTLHENSSVPMDHNSAVEQLNSPTMSTRIAPSPIIKSDTKDTFGLSESDCESPVPTSQRRNKSSIKHVSGNPQSMEESIKRNNSSLIHGPSIFEQERADETDSEYSTYQAIPHIMPYNRKNDSQPLKRRPFDYYVAIDIFVYIVMDNSCTGHVIGGTPRGDMNKKSKWYAGKRFFRSKHLSKQDVNSLTPEKDCQNAPLEGFRLIWKTSLRLVRKTRANPKSSRTRSRNFFGTNTHNIQTRNSSSKNKDDVQSLHEQDSSLVGLTESEGFKNENITPYIPLVWTENRCRQQLNKHNGHYDIHIPGTSQLTTALLAQDYNLLYRTNHQRSDPAGTDLESIYARFPRDIIPKMTKSNKKSAVSFDDYVQLASYAKDLLKIQNDSTIASLTLTLPVQILPPPSDACKIPEIDSSDEEEGPFAPPHSRKIFGGVHSQRHIPQKFDIKTTSRVQGDTTYHKIFSTTHDVGSDESSIEDTTSLSPDRQDTQSSVMLMPSCSVHSDDTIGVLKTKRISGNLNADPTQFLHNMSKPTMESHASIDEDAKQRKISHTSNSEIGTNEMESNHPFVVRSNNTESTSTIVRSEAEPSSVANQLDTVVKQSYSNANINPEFRPLHLLIVDDEKTNRMILSRMLSRQGHIYDGFCDGSDVIERFDSWTDVLNPTPISQEANRSTCDVSNDGSITRYTRSDCWAVPSDLTRTISVTNTDCGKSNASQRNSNSLGDLFGVDAILMDIVMPRMSGDTACQILRKHGVTIPIIATTGNANRQDTEQYLNNGFNAVIHKPFTTDMLAEALACVDLIYYNPAGPVKRR